MAYKFQQSVAIMSGALDQEGPITVFDDGGLVTVQLGSSNSGVANGQLSGSGNLFVGGASIFTDGVATATVAATDQIFFKTGVHGAMKKDTAGDLRDLYFSVVSGDATIAAGGALTIANDAVEQAMIADDAVGADQLAANAVVEASIVDNAVTLAKMAGLARGKIIYGDASGDPAALAAGGDGKLLVADANGDLSWTSLSGDATLSAGALTIANDAVEQAMIADDAVGADQLAANAVVNASIASNAAIDIDKLDGGSCAATLSDLAQGDLIYAGDVDDSNNIKSITFSNLEDAIFGNVSGDATIAAGGALTIGANTVEGSMLNANTAGVGLAYASNSLALDLNELSAATVSVANDSIAIIDADDSNATKKESIADLVAGMAGTGLTAANGQLSVTDGGAVNGIGDADATLTESFNYATATISDNRTWTLPASSNFAVGDVVQVKVADVGAGKKLTIARAGSQTIDGLTAIVLESPYASVSLKYVAADTFRIF